MKKLIGQGILIIIAFALQTTIFGSVYTFYMNPNLLIILTATSGFTYGKNNGMLVGFFCGLLSDVFFGNVLGVQAFIYMLLGYTNARVVEHFYSDSNSFKYIMVIITDLLYANIVYFTMFFLNGKTEYLFYFKAIMMPEVIYTILIFMVTFPVLSKIYAWFSKPMKKEGEKDAI